MSVALAPLPFLSELASNGLQLAGGKLFTYAAGTSTPQASYTDSTGGIANTNPVILNPRGEASVWLTQGIAYKLVLQDSFGNQIWSQDNIIAPLGSDFATNLAASGGSALIGFIYSGGATARTVQDKLRDSVSVKDFGAKGDGVTDDTSAFQAAINSVALDGSTLLIPSGTFKITSQLNYSTSGNKVGLKMRGAGSMRSPSVSPVGSVLYFNHADGNPFINLNGTGTSFMYQEGGKFEGFTITPGPGTNYSTLSQGPAIQYAGSWYHQLDDIAIWGCHGDGITIPFNAAADAAETTTLQCTRCTIVSNDGNGINNANAADGDIMLRATIITNNGGHGVVSQGHPSIAEDCSIAVNGLGPVSYTVSGAVNNGSGLVRLTLNSTTGLTTNNLVAVFNIVGTTEANAVWKYTVVDTTHIDLVGSTFSNAYVSGGTVRTAGAGVYLQRNPQVPGPQAENVSIRGVEFDSNVAAHILCEGVATAEFSLNRFNTSTGVNNLGYYTPPSAIKLKTDVSGSVNVDITANNNYFRTNGTAALPVSFIDAGNSSSNNRISIDGINQDLSGGTTNLTLVINQNAATQLKLVSNAALKSARYEQPQVVARMTAAQNMSTTGQTQINFDTTLFDPQSLWNAGTSVLTVPYTGVFQINLLVTVGGLASGNQVRLYVFDNTGSSLLKEWIMTASALATQSFNAFTQLSLTGGHQIIIQGDQNSGANRAFTVGSAQSELSIIGVT